MPRQTLIVLGIPEIDRKLRRLPGVVQKKVARKAMRNGIKVVAADVKRNVPVDTGLTKANVKVRAVKKRKRGEIEIEVKISGDPGLYRRYAGGTKTAFYPALVEYKHSHFMRRSFVSAGPTARQVAIDEIKIGVEEEVKKL